MVGDPLSVSSPSSLPLVSALVAETDAEPFAPPSDSGVAVAPRARAERTARLLRDWFDLVWRALVRFGVHESSLLEAIRNTSWAASSALDS